MWYYLIHLPAQVIGHGRQLMVRLAAEISTSQTLIEMRGKNWRLGAWTALHRLVIVLKT